MALSLSEIQKSLKEVPQWQLIEGQIERTFVFEKFLLGVDFVIKVAQIAEEEGHHPDIDIRYTSVKLALVTHDARGLTRKDFEVAKRVEGIMGGKLIL